MCISAANTVKVSTLKWQTQNMCLYQYSCRHFQALAMSLHTGHEVLSILWIEIGLCLADCIQGHDGMNVPERVMSGLSMVKASVCKIGAVEVRTNCAVESIGMDAAISNIWSNGVAVWFASVCRQGMTLWQPQYRALWRWIFLSLNGLFIFRFSWDRPSHPKGRLPRMEVLCHCIFGALCWWFLRTRIVGNQNPPASLSSFGNTKYWMKHLLRYVARFFTLRIFTSKRLWRWHSFFRCFVHLGHM